MSILSSTSTSNTINHLSSIFARHGYPEELLTDNGPQFSSREFADFAASLGIKHSTSSPLYPQANGLAERSVQTIKRLLSSSSDHYGALIAYRSTPLECGFSPAELLFSRRLRTTLPLTAEQRSPCVPDPAVVEERDRNIKERQTRNYDNRYSTRPLPTLDVHDPVFLPDRREDGEVVSCSNRSYVVATPSGAYRRNRRAINPLPSATTTRSGRVSRPPTRMDC